MTTRMMFVLCATALCLGIHSARADDQPFAGPSSAKPAANPPGTSSFSAANNSLSAEQRIRSALLEPTELMFNQVPLKDVIDYIHEHHHINIMFDLAALKSATPPIDPSQALVTFEIKDISLKSALNLMLSNWNLTYVIRDEVLLITTEEAASRMLATRVYNVRDLIGVNNEEELESLATLIQQAVDPSSSWQSGGGEGTLQTFTGPGMTAFVVLQTESAHEKIEKLLDNLRALRRPPFPRLKWNKCRSRNPRLFELLKLRLGRLCLHNCDNSRSL